MIASRICNALLMALLLSVGVAHGGDTNTLMTKVTYENGSCVESCIIKDTDKQVIAATSKVVPGIEYEWSEDQVGLKVVKLEATYPTEQLVKIAKECSVAIPLKLQIELPTKLINAYIADENSNQIIIEVKIPNTLERDKIVLDKICLGKEIINLSKEKQKPLLVRIIGDDGVELYQWNIERTKEATKDLNLYMEVQKSDKIPDEVFLALGQRGRQSIKGVAVLHIYENEELAEKMNIKASIDNITDFEDSKVVYCYRADLGDNGYRLTWIGELTIDVNNQVALKVNQGGYYLLLDKPLDS